MSKDSQENQEVWCRKSSAAGPIGKQLPLGQTAMQTQTNQAPVHPKGTPASSPASSHLSKDVPK